MPRAKKMTQTDMFSSLSQQLKTAALRPNINGYIPHPKQLAFHTSQSVGRQFIGGNRSGKTVAGAVELINMMRGVDPFKPVKFEPPVAVRAVGVDFLDGVDKIMLPEIARWTPPSMLKNGSWEDSYSKAARTLTYTNGSTCDFMSYEQSIEKFAGTSRNGIWFDEEPPKDIFDECLMRLIDVGGRWWISETPVEGMTWTYDTIYLASRTNPVVEVFEVETDENPYINPTEIDNMQMGLTKEEKQIRRQGKYVAFEGLIYKMIGDRHFIDPFMPPREWLHFAMMDHGLANPTCWLWAAVNEDGTIIVYDEHYVSGEIVSWHAARVHEKNTEHQRVPDYYVGDPSIKNSDPITGTSVQIEYVENGIPIILGNNDRHAGINAVAERLIGVQDRPQLFICKQTCPWLTWEIQRYRWARWASKRMAFDKNAKEEPHKKDDHACDALRYGVASRPRLDNGTEIPEYSDETPRHGADSAYDTFTDRELTRMRSGAQYVDSNLGIEY